MRKAWLWTGLIAGGAAAGCAHTPIQSGATPSSKNASQVTSPDANASAILVIDGALVTPAPTGPVTASADLTPLLVIDGVPIGSPSP